MKELLSKLLQRIEEYAGEEQFALALKEAKNNFFDQLGIPQENSESAELELANFIEWFIFDFPLEDGKRLWQKFLEEKQNELEPIEKNALGDFSRQIYGLFEIKKILPEKAVVKELVSKKKFDPVYGLEVNLKAGDLVLARVLNISGSLFFTNTFFYLPSELKKFCRKKIRLVRKNKLPKEEFFKELKAIAIKSIRYPRMKLKELCR